MFAIPVPFSLNLDNNEMMFRCYATSGPVSGNVFLFMAKLDAENNVVFSVLQVPIEDAIKKNIRSKHLINEKKVSCERYFEIVEEFAKDFKSINKNIELEMIPSQMLYNSLLKSKDNDNDDSNELVRALEAIKSTLESMSDDEVDDLFGNEEGPSDRLKPFI